MKIKAHGDGTFDIQTKNITYMNIRNMYKHGKNGAGMQISPELDDHRDEVNEICDKVATLIYQLQDIEKQADILNLQGKK